MPEFPALAVQVPNPLEAYARMQALRSGQLQIQQQQLAVENQRAMTLAMQQWDGQDPNALADLVLKNGGSGDAVMQLRARILTQQKTYSDIALQDQQTGAKKLENMQASQNQLLGRLQQSSDVEDTDLPQWLTQQVNQARVDGLINPQHAQAFLGAVQQGAANPAQLREKLSFMEKGMMGQQQQFDQATKLAATRAQQTTAAAREQEANNSQWKSFPELGLLVNTATKEVMHPAGGATMTPAQMESKYVAIQQAKKLGQKISPADQAFAGAFEDFRVMVPQYQLNAAAQISGAALDMMAQQYAQTGNLPSLGYGAAGTAMRAKIANRAAELHPQANLALAKATYGSNAGALKHIQTQFAQVNAFESTAEKNLDQLQAAAKDVPDLTARFANVPVRMISEKMIGTTAMARFRVALTTAQTETAKVLNSANATGVLSDSARGELQQVLSGNLSYGAMVSAINQLKIDMGNRRTSYQQQIDDLEREIGGKSATAPAAVKILSPAEWLAQQQKK
jgi:hypothetical protein